MYIWGFGNNFVYCIMYCIIQKRPILACFSIFLCISVWMKRLKNKAIARQMQSKNHQKNAKNRNFSVVFYDFLKNRRSKMPVQLVLTAGQGYYIP